MNEEVTWRKKSNKERKKERKGEREIERERENRVRKFRVKIQRDPSPVQILSVSLPFNQ